MNKQALFARITHLGRKLVEPVTAPGEGYSSSKPDVDQALLALTYSRVRYRLGGRTIVNGLVDIGNSRNGEEATVRFSSAHVHDYGTGVIRNELRKILDDAPGTHDAELRIELSPKPSLFDEADLPTRIVFQYVGGPLVGRTFYFAPVSGDKDGWSEMSAYAERLIANNAVQRICRQEVTAAA